MAIDTIKFKRGVKSKLNNLSYGEPAYISDENELYIGTENGVEKITRNKEVAELSSQLEHKTNEYVDVFYFGAIGDDKDYTQELQKAFDYANKVKKSIYIRNGNYRISQSLIIYSNMSIVGESRDNTLLIRTSDIPIFKTKSDIGSSRIRIEKIGFINNLQTSRTFLIDMINTYNSSVVNCLFYSDTLTVNDISGISFRKTSDYKGQFWVNKIENCQLSESCIEINSSDSYITNNEIWSKNRPYSIKIGAGSLFVIGNQIVPSTLNGGLYADGIKEIHQLRVFENYFDGGADEDDTGVGININNIRYINISNNDFWHIKKNSIILNSCKNFIIDSNLFNESNYSCDSYDDVVINNSAFYSITNNNHRREKIGGNFGRGYCIENSISPSKNIFSQNTVTGKYQTSYFDRSVQIFNNVGISDISKSFKCGIPTSTTVSNSGILPLSNIFVENDICTLNSNTITFNESGVFLIELCMRFQNTNDAVGGRFTIFEEWNSSISSRRCELFMPAQKSFTCSASFVNRYTSGNTLKFNYFTEQTVKLFSEETDYFVKITKIS